MTTNDESTSTTSRREVLQLAGLGAMVFGIAGGSVARATEAAAQTTATAATASASGAVPYNILFVLTDTSG